MFEISLKIDRTHKVWEMLANNRNPLLTSRHIGTHIDVYNKTEVSKEYLDCAGIRRGEEHYNADVKCENKKTYVVENLSSESLNKMEFNKFKVFTVRIDNLIATGLSTKIFVYGDR